MEQYKGVTIRVDNIRSDFPCLVHYNVHKLYKEYEQDANSDEIYMVLTLDELACLEAIHNIISSWLDYDIYPELQIIE